MPGAGKSTVANFLKEKNFHIVNMGDVIREKALERNLPQDDNNLGKLMKELREEHGNEIVAKLILQKIQKLKNNNFIVIDGIRSHEEFMVLKALEFIKLLAIHASSDIRYDHIKFRERSDSPANYEKFIQRDEREMNIGISKAIALADEAISNNNLTITELENQVEKIVNKWIDEYNNTKFLNKK